MLRTTYLNLKKPEGSDPVNVQDFNDNADTIDTEVNARVKSSGGDIANTKVSAFTASTASYPVPAAGETPKVFMGKIKKFFEDFKSFKDSIVTKTMILNQILNDSTKAASAATVYSVNEKVDSAISDLAASSVKCADGAGMAGSALYADKFGKIICIRGYVKPTNGYSFDAWNRQIVAWLPNNNYLPRGQVTGLTIYSDSRLKIEINVDNSVVLQNLSGSAITANGESGIDIMITYCCQ